MKRLLVAFFLLCRISSNAQIFAPPGAVWSYSAVDPWNWDAQSTQVAYYVGDSLINDTLSKQIRAGYFLYEEYYYFYSTNDAIYCYSFVTHKFVKLFDYNLNIGDSLFIRPIACGGTSDGAYYKIVDKGVETISGNPYRWLDYQLTWYDSYSEDMYGRYYEKLGWNYFIAPDPGCGNYSQYITGRCQYRDSTTQIGVCTSGIEETHTDKFSLYPNPTSNGTLTIQNKATVKSMELIDMLGQNVMSAAPFGNTVNIGSVAQGIYVAKVVFVDGKTGYKRVVVN